MVAPLIAQEIVRRIIGTRTISFRSDPGDTGGPDVVRNQPSDQFLIRGGFGQGPLTTRAALVARRVAFFASQRVRGSRVRPDRIARFARLGRVPRETLRRFVSLRPPAQRRTSLQFRAGGSFRSVPLDRLAPSNLNNPSLAERLEDPHGLS